MKRTALKIGYIGTNFHGFQRQPNLRTVEEELIYHLRKLDYIDDLKKSRFRIAGRTDAGVHSLGNVISFQSEKEVRVNEINNSLPDDIQILASAPVRYAFKPRYAQMRQYRYMLFQDLDIDKLNECAEVFKGTHNFTNFTKRFQKTTTRTIDDINISNIINLQCLDSLLGRSIDSLVLETDREPYGIATYKFYRLEKGNLILLQEKYLGQLRLNNEEPDCHW